VRKVRELHMCFSSDTTISPAFALTHSHVFSASPGGDNVKFLNLQRPEKATIFCELNIQLLGFVTETSNSCCSPPF